MIKMKLQVNNPSLDTIAIKEGLAMFLEPIGTIDFIEIDNKGNLKLYLWSIVNAPDGSKSQIEQAMQFYQKCYQDCVVLSIEEEGFQQTKFG